MLNELEKYYSEKGILSTNFTCAKECWKGHEEKFTGPKSSYVGEEYEKGTLPRLLFLSLDSGDGTRNAENNLPDAIRKGVINYVFKNRKEQKGSYKVKHWYRTHELAICLLQKFDQHIKTIENVKPYFSHVNSAKCCMNKKGRKEGDHFIFTNCREYLHDELVILKPDIIVTQGNRAKEAIYFIIDAYKQDVKKVPEDKNHPKNKYFSIIDFHGRKVFWLHTYHPSAYGYFNDQKKNWDKYAEEIRKFRDLLSGQ